MPEIWNRDFRSQETGFPRFFKSIEGDLLLSVSRDAPRFKNGVIFDLSATRLHPFHNPREILRKIKNHKILKKPWSQIFRGPSFLNIIRDFQISRRNFSSNYFWKLEVTISRYCNLLAWFFSKSNKKSEFRDFERMSSEDQKAEYVSRAKLSEQAERYDDMAEFMRLVTESGIGNYFIILNFLSKKFDHVLIWLIVNLRIYKIFLDLHF